MASLFFIDIQGLRNFCFVLVQLRTSLSLPIPISLQKFRRRIIRVWVGLMIFFTHPLIGSNCLLKGVIMCEYHMQKVVNYLKFKIGVEKRNVESAELYIRSMNDDKKRLEERIQKLNAELADVKTNMAKAQSSLRIYNTNIKKYDDTIETLKGLINN